MSKSLIKEEVVKLSEIIKPQLNIDKDGVFNVPDNIYSNSLPEGVTIELVNKIAEHNSNFYASAALAVGDISSDSFVNDKELKSTTAEFKLGGDDTFTTVHSRSIERRIPNSNGGMSEPVTIYGSMRNTITNEGSRMTLVPMSQVKSWLQEQALEKYGK